MKNSQNLKKAPDNDGVITKEEMIGKIRNKGLNDPNVQMFFSMWIMQEQARLGTTGNRKAYAMFVFDVADMYIADTKNRNFTMIKQFLKSIQDELPTWTITGREREEIEGKLAEKLKEVELLDK